MRRSAHASRHAVRRDGHDRRRHVGPDRCRLRRHDVPRRLLHPDARAARSRTPSTPGTRSARGSRSSTWATTSRSPTFARAARSRSSRDYPEQGITSYKLFMAYKGALMVDDETLFRTMEVAAETGALVMVHAENGDAIDVLVKQALAAGNTAPHYHALTRPPETEGEATNRAIQLARVAGAPLYVVHVSCKESRRSDRPRPRARLGRLGRDLHAVLLHRLHVPRAPGLRGCEVRLHAAAARDREPGRALARGAIGHPLGDLDRPLRVPLGRAEVARAATTSRRSRTAARDSRTGCT